MFRSIGERFNLNSSQTTRAKRHTTAIKPPKKKDRGLNLKIDVIFFVSVIMLMVFGMIMVYSSSYDFAKREIGNSSAIFNRQLIVMAIGVAGIIFLTFFDYHNLKNFALAGLIIAIVSLLAVLIFGEERHGAARGLLGGSVQPSEFSKLAIIIYLSVWLYAKREQLSKVTFGLIPLAIILGIISAFVLLQPDISAVFTIMFIGILMFILAGGDLKQIGIILLLALSVGWFTLGLFPTGRVRIQEFFTGLINPSEGSYHVIRSFEAFIKGGWFGVGIGNSETKLTGLPVPHTDSVFAVVGEETGVVGAIGLLILFSLILWRGLKIARRAPDMMGSLLAAGLSIWIAFEAFINMAGIVNVMPFAGNALPFISAGGSSLLVTLLAVGVLLNISRQAVTREEQKGKEIGEVIDLRRRDRRGSVPRARRSAGAKANR